MKATTKEWLDFAEADLMNCELIMNVEFLTNIVAFHSQQAVEKTFKSYFEENEMTIPRVHNLQRLYAIIIQTASIEFDIKELALLDNVYTSSRYPGEIGILETGKPSIQEAKELFDSAKRICFAIRKYIESKQ